jgi:hypothetical protein
MIEQKETQETSTPLSYTRNHFAFHFTLLAIPKTLPANYPTMLMLLSNARKRADLSTRAGCLRMLLACLLVDSAIIMFAYIAILAATVRFQSPLGHVLCAQVNDRRRRQPVD